MIAIYVNMHRYNINLEVKTRTIGQKGNQSVKAYIRF